MSLLNERLRLKLTKHDINYMYNCQILSKSDSSKSDWYLNAQNGPIRLISYLPNLNKPTEGGYDVHEIYTIKYSHIYIFSLTFMLFCD